MLALVIFSILAFPSFIDGLPTIKYVRTIKRGEDYDIPIGFRAWVAPDKREIQPNQRDLNVLSTVSDVADNALPTVVPSAVNQVLAAAAQPSNDSSTQPSAFARTVVNVNNMLPDVAKNVGDLGNSISGALLRPTTPPTSSPANSIPNPLSSVAKALLPSVLSTSISTSLPLPTIPVAINNQVTSAAQVKPNDPQSTSTSTVMVLVTAKSSDNPNLVAASSGTGSTGGSIHLKVDSLLCAVVTILSVWFIAV